MVKSKINKKCITCDKEFSVYPSLNRIKFCSRKCYSETLKGHTPWNKGLKGYLGGEKHYKWQEKPSYVAVHHWINKKLGKPSACDFCKTTMAPRFEWANVSRKYKREISDWVRLCKKCHNRYDDITNRGWKTRKEVVGL